MDLTANVLFADGIDNMGGITRRAFLAFASSFTSLGTPTVSTSFASRVTISTNHVLATGKKMIELYVMYDKSGLESPLVGGRKGKSFKPKATLMYPGTDAECLGLISTIKNSDLILLVEEQDGTGMLQIGTANLPASLDAGSVKTGNSPEGEKGISFEITAPSREAWYKYTGTLPTVGA